MAKKVGSVGGNPGKPNNAPSTGGAGAPVMDPLIHPEQGKMGWNHPGPKKGRRK